MALCKSWVRVRNDAKLSCCKTGAMSVLGAAGPGGAAPATWTCPPVAAIAPQADKNELWQKKQNSEKTRNPKTVSSIITMSSESALDKGQILNNLDVQFFPEQFQLQ